MGVAWGRLGLWVLVLLVAVPAATVFAQKGGEEGPIPERDTQCWPCHVTWSPPLKTFYNILPPAEAGAEVGQPFDVVIQLQSAWTPPKAKPFLITYNEPALDLTNAPSLGFFSDVPPLHEEERGSLSPDPSGPTTPVRQAFTWPLPQGATRLTVTLTPDTPSQQTGPDLVLNVYPGSSAPTGNPTRVDAAGRGGTEVFELLGADAFLGSGYGNWTFEAEWTPVVADPTDPSFVGAPSATAQTFLLTIDSAVEDTGERIQRQPNGDDIPEGGSALLRFRLVANTQPAPGETVGLTVNATVYYEHDKGSSPVDYANATKPLPEPIPVTTDGPRVVLRTVVAEDTVVGGGVQNGATMDTVSEAMGYGTAFLLLASIWTGGMFGKASRRQLNGVFGTAKRRVAFHNFLSYGLMLFASVHTVLFILELAYHWTIGLLWGGTALLAMLLLGVTGAFQVQMIRRWNYGTWRWSHYGLAVAAIVFTLVHMALDGVHFGFVQDFLGWKDPLVPDRLQ